MHGPSFWFGVACGVIALSLFEWGSLWVLGAFIDY